VFRRRYRPGHRLSGAGSSAAKLGVAGGSNSRLLPNWTLSGRRQARHADHHRRIGRSLHFKQQRMGRSMDGRSAQARLAPAGLQPANARAPTKNAPHHDPHCDRHQGTARRRRSTRGVPAVALNTASAVTLARRCSAERATEPSAGIAGCPWRRRQFARRIQWNIGRSQQGSATPAEMIALRRPARGLDLAHGYELTCRFACYCRDLAAAVCALWALEAESSFHCRLPCTMAACDARSRGTSDARCFR